MGYGRWGWRALSILLHAGEDTCTSLEPVVTCSLIDTRSRRGSRFGTAHMLILRVGRAKDKSANHDDKHSFLRLARERRQSIVSPTPHLHSGKGHHDDITT